jgi:hypothetical protein
MATDTLSDAELIALLRKQVSAWFSNSNLLLFEELIRRYEHVRRIQLQGGETESAADERAADE